MRLEEFFQQAAEYVLSKDRSWISHASKAPAVADPDRIREDADATSDQ